MQILMPNPCTRCGKERIVSKTWTENHGQSVLYRTDTICPDKDCQKVVDEIVAAQRERKTAIELKKTRDKEERAKLLANKS